MSWASNVTVSVVAHGLGFPEGPVIAPDGRAFVVSITHGAVYRLDPAAPSGAVRHATTGGGANGAALAADASIYVAQNGGRWARNGPAWPASSVGGVQRVAADGSVSWVTRDPIAPNDLCFGPDGLLYVTDPTRRPPSKERAADGRIWRVDPATGTAELLLSVPWFPNGIAFGPDDRLYVAATDLATIFVFDVVGYELINGRPYVEMTENQPDGMAFDREGNLIIGAIAHEEGRGTVQVWDRDGRQVDTFYPGPEPIYANLAFTTDGELLITGSSNGEALLTHGWPTPGLALHPFR